MDYYTISDEIATGYFGSSYRVREKHGKKRFRSMQMIKFDCEDRAKYGLSAIQSLFSLSKHQHIARHRDAFLHYQHGAQFVNAVLEVCLSTNLNDYILRRHRDLDDNCFKAFMLQLLDGLAYLHQNKVYHSALTPYNIMVGYSAKNELCLKITNFGLDGICKPDVETSKGDPTVRSYVFYSPPEYSCPYPQQTRRHPDKADIFALGMVFCSMLEFTVLDGESPKDRILATYVQFPGYGTIPVGKFLRQNPSVDLDRHLFSTTSTDIRRIVRQMLNANSSHRPSAKSVRKHLASCHIIRNPTQEPENKPVCERKDNIGTRCRKRKRDALGEDFSCLNTPMKKPRARMPKAPSKPGGLLGYFGAVATAAGMYWGLRKENSIAL